MYSIQRGSYSTDIYIQYLQPLLEWLKYKQSFSTLQWWINHILNKDLHSVTSKLAGCLLPECGNRNWPFHGARAFRLVVSTILFLATILRPSIVSASQSAKRGWLYCRPRQARWNVNSDPAHIDGEVIWRAPQANSCNEDVTVPLFRLYLWYCNGRLGRDRSKTAPRSLSMLPGAFRFKNSMTALITALEGSEGKQLRTLVRALKISGEYNLLLAACFPNHRKNLDILMNRICIINFTSAMCRSRDWQCFDNLENNFRIRRRSALLS